MGKLTLEEKKLINEHVTGETKRCLAIFKKLRQEVEHNFITYEKIEDFYNDYDLIITDLIKGSPYIEFHPELKKRIPK